MGLLSRCTKKAKVHAGAVMCTQAMKSLISTNQEERYQQGENFHVIFFTESLLKSPCRPFPIIWAGWNMEKDHSRDFPFRSQKETLIKQNIGNYETQLLKFSPGGQVRVDHRVQVTIHQMTYHNTH